MKARVCELCDGEAALYCPADSAFLCFACDSKVHSANFLVARHVRRAVCSNCRSLTTDVRSPPVISICRSCSHESTSSSSSSASCSDNTKLNRSKSPSPVNLTTAARRLESKAEAVVANWCGKMGIERSFVCDVVMPVAMEAVGVCSSELTFLPFRVVVTASLWYSLRMSGDGSVSTWQALKKIERISGVSAKLILAAESKISRPLMSRRRKGSDDDQLEEGWAEC